MRLFGGLALFRTGLTLGYVRDWCAESGQGVLGFARKRAMMATETPLSDVRFLTVAEVATIMRVSKMTVYRLVHSGELEAIRVGRSFRVPEQAVNQYLRAAFVGTA
jgi:excisionase family DNA binding protein